MNKRKVCVVITARPSYSRIKTALEAMKMHKGIELYIVAAASALLDRYGTAANYIENDGFKIHTKVFMVLEGENLTSMAKTTGLGILELSTAFENIKPDIVVTIADRFETIATAIAASYMNIPVAHIQGGEVTGNIDERVRHAVTKLSDYHFVTTRKSAERVIKMGEKEKNVFVTGCPSIDLAKDVSKSQLKSDLFKKYKGVGKAFNISSSFITLMQHPVTNEYSSSFEHMNNSLQVLKKLNIPALVFWPNIDAGSDGTSKAIRVFRENNSSLPFYYLKGMEPEDFLHLMMKTSCLIGNSSVGIRECSYLGTPVVNIGSRQSGRERGKNVIDTDYNIENIIKAVNKQISQGRQSADETYGGGDAGKKIADLLASVELTIDKKLAY